MCSGSLSIIVHCSRHSFGISSRHLFTCECCAEGEELQLPTVRRSEELMAADYWDKTRKVWVFKKV